MNASISSSSSIMEHIDEPSPSQVQKGDLLIRMEECAETSTVKSAIPLPGKYWPEQAAFYAGITPLGHHLLLPDAPEFYFQYIEWGIKGKKIADANSDHDGLANTIAMPAANAQTLQQLLRRCRVKVNGLIYTGLYLSTCDAILDAQERFGFDARISANRDLP